MENNTTNAVKLLMVHVKIDNNLIEKIEDGMNLLQRFIDMKFKNQMSNLIVGRFGVVGSGVD
ncbi:hypothetical protein KDD93_07090 [Campylobacter sp. faydin G-24]|uniref:Uncharacterized protein n=1 Tax=Campylobacter anatolicus TaxID=2829105 RepID=A0ABS5HJT7_9BACT|nr:hypothetical protein [Campylobacter anatolicus]MBR8464326.1 hypothetical protein [Campylobacter anatolicus]